MSTGQHWFGLPLPRGVKAARQWGARAILRTSYDRRRCTSTTHVELVPDRSNYRGPDYIEADFLRKDSVAFFRWVEKDALAWLFKAADKQGLCPDEDRELGLDRGRYHIRANPRKSYGYLYIICWEDERNGTQEEA